MKREVFIRDAGKAHGLVSYGKMEYLTFEAYRLAAGETLRLPESAEDTGVVLMRGKCDIAAGGETYTAGRRMDIFEGTPPYAWLCPAGCAATLTALTDIHFSVSRAQHKGLTKPMLITPEMVRRDDRYPGTNTYRYVYTIIPDGVPTALMLYEVFVPDGNWSGVPIHKHDVENPPDEALLNESYYFMLDKPEGFAFQWICNDDFSEDHVHTVRSNDLMLVFEGYHPVVSGPGYCCYEQCVMAGPNNVLHAHVHEKYR